MKVKEEIQQKRTPVVSNHGVEKMKKGKENQREIVLEGQVSSFSSRVCVLKGEKE